MAPKRLSAAQPADMLVFKQVGPITELHDGTLFPETAHVAVVPSVRDAVAIDLYLRVDDGDVVISHIVIGRGRDGALLTTALLKSLDVDAIRQQATHALAYTVEQQARLPLSPADHAFLDAFEPPDDRERRRRRVNDELLKRVAAIYREAARGGAPIQAVSERLATSHRNASRWVKLARDRGLLNS